MLFAVVNLGWRGVVKRQILEEDAGLPGQQTSFTSIGILPILDLESLSITQTLKMNVH